MCAKEKGFKTSSGELRTKEKEYILREFGKQTRGLKTIVGELCITKTSGPTIVVGLMMVSIYSIYKALEGHEDGNAAVGIYQRQGVQKQ